jgi:hypothetical protein
MAASDDWYRSRDWDEAGRELFERKLARAQSASGRAQYLFIKANALSKKHPEAEVELLYRALNELDGPRAAGAALQADLSYLAYLNTQLGERLQERGLLHRAEHHFRTAVRVCPLEQRKVLGPFQAEELLGAMLVRSPVKSRREEGERFWEMYHRWSFEQQRRQRTFLSSEELEQKPHHLPDDAAELGPEEAAELVFAEYRGALGAEVLSRADRSSLEALDRHFHQARHLRPRASIGYRILVALGAYLGHVLVRELGGSWTVRRPLMRSRVRAGGRALNPFLAGYKAFFFEYPLVGLFDEAAQSVKMGPSKS